MCLRFFLILFSLFVLSASMVQAADYTVRNLAVDVEGDNAIDAREKALTQARSNAFDVLKKRLSEQGEAIPTPDANTVASMVDSFEINREKLSKNRYLASVNVTFNERAVQSYVGRYSNVAMPDDSVGQEPVVQPQQQETAPIYGNNAYNPAQIQTQPAMANYQTPQPAPLNRPLTQSTMRVDIADFRQWIGIKRALESTYSVQSVMVEQISPRQAVVNLVHQGTINDLQGVLIGRGMKLYTNTDAATRAAVPYILVTRG